MSDKQKFPRLTTARGVAIWPHLNTPDTKWKKEGKYSTKLAFDEEAQATPQFKAMVEKVEALIEARYEEEAEKLKSSGKAALAKKIVKASPFKEEEDAETGELTGRIIINAGMTASGVSEKTGKSWKRKPNIYDAFGNLIKNPPNIGSGSVLKLNVELFPYFNQKDKEVGVSLRLEAVQVVKLVSYGQRDASDYGFEAEEDGDDLSGYGDDDDFADDGDDGDEDDDI
jgi:hypothetical protein